MNAKKRPDRRDLTKLDSWKHKPEDDRNYQAFFSIPADLDIYTYVGRELEAFDWMLNREEMNLWMETNVSKKPLPFYFRVIWPKLLPLIGFISVLPEFHFFPGSFEENQEGAGKSSTSHR